MMKKIITFGLMAFMLVTWSLGAWAADFKTQEIKLNNRILQLGAYAEDGSLYLPVREICETMGYKVGWMPSDHLISLDNQQRSFSLDLKNRLIGDDDHLFYFSHEYRIIQGRTYFAAEFFSDYFSMQTQWDQSEGTVLLKKIQENNITIDTVKESSENDTLKITLQYPVIEGMKSQMLQDEINGIFKELAEKAAQEGKNNALSLTEAAKEVKDWIPNQCETYFNYQIKFNQKNILSLVFQNYQYAGGAHGSTVQTSYTINLETGQQYALKDLFREDADYVSLISNEVKQQLEERDLTEALFEPFDQIAADQPYYLSNNGIVVYFQQYEILPYAAGIQEFSNEQLPSQLLNDPELFQ